MLARLEELGGVERAETDYAGELLRLSLRDERALAPALVLLVSLGYGAEPTAREPVVVTWYDARSVGQLSRVEADVVADRITSRFIGTHPLAVGEATRLRAAMADALHACFVATALDAGPSSDSFRMDCVRRAVAAVVPVVGDVSANDLGRLLDDDMRHSQRQRP